MIRLYITRHGQTTWNIEKRMQGWKDSDLTDEGISNAMLLGNHLKDTKMDYVYSSPIQRAYKTAELICGDRDIKIIPHDDFREINLGAWEGKTIEDIQNKYPNEFRDFWNAPHKFKPVGGETFLEVQRRALRGINEILTLGDDINVLIVTHTVTLKSLMTHFEGRQIETLWNLPYIYDTSLSLVEVEGNDVKVILHGDTSHLPIRE